MNSTEDKKECISNVLKAFVKRNQSVGYFVGLEIIVNHLMRYMDEEEAFWSLSTLLESVLPLDYYASHIGVMVDNTLFCRLAKKLVPTLYKFLRGKKVELSLLSFGWFLHLFTWGISPRVTDAVWDQFVVGKTKVLFRAGLALLSLVEKNVVVQKTRGTV